jgi:curved DNA-binding protein CbpA
MVASDSLKKSDIREVASLMKGGRNSEEAVNAVNGSNREAVDKALREQVVVVLSSLLAWDAFEMRFYPGENLIQNRTSLGLDVAETLVLSARRAASKKIVALPRECLEGMIVSNSEWSEKKIRLPLNDAESYIHTRTFNAIPAKELLPLVSAKTADAEMVLLSLYALGLIDVQTAHEIPGGRKTGAAESCLTSIEEMLERFRGGGFYEVLAVEPDAGQDRIQAAYHELAKLYHPDRFQSREFSNNIRSQAEQVFFYINRAYTTLRDPVQRSLYDEERLKTKGGDAAPKKAKQSDTTEDEAIEALFNLGRKSLVQGDFEKAAKELKSCVYLRPENAQYNHFLGLAESEVRGLYKSAEQHFFKAVELDPALIESRIALARLYLKVRLRRKALLALEEVLQWDPDNPEAQKIRNQIKKMDAG